MIGSPLASTAVSCNFEGSRCHGKPTRLLEEDEDNNGLEGLGSRHSGKKTEVPQVGLNLVDRIWTQNLVSWKYLIHKTLKNTTPLLLYVLEICKWNHFFGKTYDIWFIWLWCDPHFFMSSCLARNIIQGKRQRAKARHCKRHLVLFSQWKSAVHP